nr:nitroreductase family protein [Frankia sp. Cas4]
MDPVTGIDVTSADLLLSTTRAVRKRLDLNRPVPPAVIRECIQLALQAPTASNGQGWRWLVITDSDMRRRLAELYRQSEAYLHKKAAQVPGSDLQTRRVYDSALYLSENLERVPAHVIPCIEGRVDGADNAVAAAHYASIIPATWSFMLALRARGLGSAWTSLHLVKEKETAELLGIPGNVTQIALIPVAYTIGSDFKPAARGPAEAVTFWNSWGG